MYEALGVKDIDQLLPPPPQPQPPPPPPGPAVGGPARAGAGLGRAGASLGRAGASSGRRPGVLLASDHITDIRQVEVPSRNIEVSS